MEIKKKDWELFLKWKSKNDDENLKLGSGTTEREGNNPEHKGSNLRDNTAGNQTKNETITFQENKPPVSNVETEEVRCAGCGYSGLFPINKYPEKCPQCDELWR